MAQGRYGTALRQIHVLFNVGTNGGLTDGQLLERFTSCDQEAAELAFAALIERHGPMVLRVCHSVLHERHDAEDAFQATFLILVRKAASIRKHGSVVSWLHGVAFRVASCQKGATSRHRRHERILAERRRRAHTTAIKKSAHRLFTMKSIGSRRGIGHRSCSAISRASRTSKRRSSSAGRSERSEAGWPGVGTNFGADCGAGGLLRRSS